MGEAGTARSVDPDEQGPAARLDKGDAMFPHVGRWARGYDPDQVDVFFARARTAYEGPVEDAMRAEEVRHASFDLVHGGYTAAVVDAALDRLEAAFLKRERAAFASLHGEQAWAERTNELVRTLQPRAERPAGLRFAHPDHGPGYAVEDVDALVDRLLSHFERGSELTSQEVRTATFRSARGNNAYAEGPVDAYLDRAVQVLMAAE